ALEFYASGEQAGAKAEDAFELSADGPVFGPAADFATWKVESTDEDSPTLKAIRLYQKLLVFHQNDQDPAARLDADLDRLKFAYNKAVGEEKRARYIAALKRFAEQNAKHELSAMARYHWASALREDNQLVDAHQVASQGRKAFPQSAGGKLCGNLVQEIEAPGVSIATERVWNEPWPTIDVQYRNIRVAYFRLLKLDWVSRLTPNRYRPEQWTPEDQNQLLQRKPDVEWKVDLPATEDFQLDTEQVQLPKNLAPGYYVVLASHQPNFSEVNNNHVSYCDVWVSKLALVTRHAYTSTQVDGFVLDALSGEPLADANVRVWYRSNQNNAIQEGPAVKTNANGLFSAPGRENHRVLLLAEHNGQQIAAGNDFFSFGRQPNPPTPEQVILFTDRSIYRPGQTINYKGICVQVNQEADNYQTVAKREITVLFLDPNGKEIERRTQQTNDYGSISGSFTAPRDRVTGRMMINVQGPQVGGTQVSVEEYKRPKFKVELNAPAVAPKLNEQVQLKGKATAYTGAVIDGAKVRYRCTREARYPIWRGCLYCRRQPQGGTQEIAHGTAETGVDGSFNIEFVAKPDRSVAEKDEPTFHYSISADVTDSTGETRTGSRSINVGYTALKAEVGADEWQAVGKPVELTIKTESLDGEGQKAEGKLRVYRLKQPEKVLRSQFQTGMPMPGPRRRGPIAGGGRGAGGKPAPVVNPNGPPPTDPANPNSWELAEAVFDEAFTTDDRGQLKKQVNIPAGIYRVVLETQDRFGKTVTARLPLRVLDPAAEKLNIKVPQVFAAPKWSVEPGAEFMALWGTGYDQGRAYIELEHRGKLVQSFWTPGDRTQASVKLAVQELHRGGFTVRVTQVRENRAYVESRHVDVPWTNKNLTVKWEHFVSKLQPGQKETWTAVISGPDAKQAVAEMVATLYDESLDAYQPHAWQQRFQFFRQDISPLQVMFDNGWRPFNYIAGQWFTSGEGVDLRYRAFPADLTVNLWDFQMLRDARGMGGGGGRMMMRGGMAPQAAGMPAEMAAAPGRSNRALAMDAVMAKSTADGANGMDKPGGIPTSNDGGGRAPDMDLSKVAARKNLNETAFFFPHLMADEKGQVKLEFTMPEALTQWKFMGFAHDRNLRSGYLQDNAVTAKELMVQPNPPRFLREGDSIEFTVKVTNQSATRQQGTVRLSLTDAGSSESIDSSVGNSSPDKSFDIPAGESRSVAWRLTIPDGLGPIAYKAVGSTGRVSDGEEAMLPVLSRRLLVIESLPLPIRDAGTKKFEFAKLKAAGESKTLRTESLTVQMVSNPSWYAVMALPYLMETHHETSEQVFNRLYANSLARHIAASDPKIERVFEQWRGTPALDSPLEKNQELKAVTLEETPWLRQARKESQARRDVGILFDKNRLENETTRLLQQLRERQHEDGGWSWCPGGPTNDYITLYITTGFGRLRHLGVELDVSPALVSIDRLDNWMTNIYNEIMKHSKDKEANHLSATIALYLYGRSFFLQEKPIQPPHQAAFDYFRKQAGKHWLKLNNRQSQAHLAIALKRIGDLPAATDIMKSLKERSVTNEELGRFWRDTELSWWWYRAPIETQALMIEAFDEVMKDAAAVEECKVWLLKQKQTQDWKTTKATADAVYGLLLRGTNVLASNQLVEVTLGEQTIKPEKTEAGTGFYEQRFIRGEVKPEFGSITVKKKDAGVAWGSVHWQYLEDMSKVTPYEGTPLKLKKALFIKENTKKGPVLKPVTGPVAVGDELVVRLELRTDRDMEYVHLKDYRGSGTEPVNVLSQYKYRDGLGYYESTRDAASHFFIDYLPKGVYVFEYSTRVQLKGQYQTGIAQIQCLYAPEFNSHSESLVLEVK
ncbi:MAG: alpha-2-macroglobulin family protein, partial [Planctomycetota bacterium]